MEFCKCVGLTDPTSPPVSDKSVDTPSGVVETTRIPARAIERATLEKEKIGDNGTTLCATYLWRTGSTEGVPAETKGESANTGRGRHPRPPSPMVFREEIVTDRRESSGILLETKEFLNGNP